MNYDVVMVGGGNAALCAALAAEERGARIVLERAPHDERGGNSRFTAGAIRFAHRGVDDLRQVMPDLTDDEITLTDFGAYTEDQFFDDMFHVTRYGTDPVLCEMLVRRSFETMKWLHGNGVRFQPIGIQDRRQVQVPGRVDGRDMGRRPRPHRQRGRHCDGGRRRDPLWRCVLDLLHNGHCVTGVRIKQGARIDEISAGAVVLASSGFESDPEMRARYLGPGWELARVRGTRFNTGDGIKMALAVGAAAYGNWSGCHAVGRDFSAPEFGDLAVGDGFQKHSYPFGIMVNAFGRRFIDEGADFRDYIYAKYGRTILEQPGNFA